MAIGACALGGAGAPTLADQTLFGPLAAGVYQFSGENITLNGLVLNGDVEIIVTDGKIIVAGSGVSSGAGAAMNGLSGSSSSCGVSIVATNGHHGANGYSLALRTIASGSPSSATDIEINAAINLPGLNGGNGGNGRNGTYYSPPVTCCQVAPASGAHGGNGGRGGKVSIDAANNVKLTSTVDLDGGNGGNAGAAGQPYAGQAATSVAYAGAAGAGGSAGVLRVQAGSFIYINSNVVLSLIGGAGGAGAKGAHCLTSTRGSDGGAGGDGGVVELLGSFLGAQGGFSGTIALSSYGGSGGNGGNGAGGETSNSFTACGSPDPGQCKPAVALRGEARPGGIGGRGGNGGTTQITIAGNITLPNVSSTPGLSIASYGAWSGSQSGSTPDSGAVMNSSCCPVGRAGLAGATGLDGGIGGAIVITGEVITLNNCGLDVCGGMGGHAAHGGVGTYLGCGAVPAGGNGGEGGYGGVGGTIQIIANVSMNCTGGFYLICGGIGGNGGNGGAGGCPGGLGGVGGTQGIPGTFFADGSGTPPSAASCSFVADGTDGNNYCP